MSLNQSAVRELYTKKLKSYAAFVGFFHSKDGMCALLKHSTVLQPNMTILDAGCGFGLASFALTEALHSKNMTYKRLDAFDLTPAMLAHFRKQLTLRPSKKVQLQQADVLEPENLPESWKGYDLILSTSMLEYLPKKKLSQALINLRKRMVPGGHIIIMITRNTFEAKILIEKSWHAERYSLPDLKSAFQEAGFNNMKRIRFPWRYGWLNRANYVVVANYPREIQE